MFQPTKREYTFSSPFFLEDSFVDEFFLSIFIWIIHSIGKKKLLTRLAKSLFSSRVCLVSYRNGKIIENRAWCNDVRVNCWIENFEHNWLSCR